MNKAELHMACLRESITQQQEEMHEKRRKAILSSQLPSPFSLLVFAVDCARGGMEISMKLSQYI